MKNIYYYLPLLLIVVSNSAFGQISFALRNDLINNQHYHSGVAIIVADINNDGLDDIAHLQNGKDLMVEYQNSNGSTFTNFTFGPVSGQNEWSICAGDIDRNGSLDILTGGAYDGMKLIKSNSNGQPAVMTTIAGSLFAQGTNVVDINNDGWLDYFSCHDDGESFIWGNDQTGNLLLHNEWIDLSTFPVSDNSGNYGSEWTDIDNDGDLDLYIAKCRQGVTNPADPRRINQLFINNNGVFTENAAAWNLNIGAQSWTADFGDINNDGLLDCFITNHDVASQLLINNGTTFTDITSTSGLNVTVLPIQGVFKDLDNDGFLDIIVAGSSYEVWKNNGDATFTLLNSQVLGTSPMESFAVGDLNHDGFLDIYGGYASIYTTPTSIDDKVWINNGNSNNYVAVKLTGVTSNIDGIGARINCYGPWGKQIREVRSGESYGIMNSLTQHFGLGTSTQIDSIEVLWPSGLRDIILNPAINQFISITENQCVSPPSSVTVAPNHVICPGEVATLSAQPGYTYLWNTGETTSQISVTSGGNYRVTVYNPDQPTCYQVSPNIEIIYDPVSIPSITIQGDSIFCKGDSIQLVSSLSSQYQWSTGENTQSIFVTQSGEYTVTTAGVCRNFTSDPFHILVLDPTPSVENDSIDYNTSATLFVSGNNVEWFDANQNLLFAGNTYQTPLLTENTDYFVKNTSLIAGDRFTVGPVNHEGNDYNSDQYNGQLIFDVMSDLILDSVTVFTDFPATRTIELLNANNEVVASKSVNITDTVTVINLDFEIQAGVNYKLTTNTQMNLNNFGVNNPKLKRSDANVTYPYIANEQVNIKSSNLGDSFYYYFYNWKIKNKDFVCESQLVPVSVFVRDIVDNKEVVESNSDKCLIFPNPTHNELQILLFDDAKIMKISIMNAQGQLLESFDNFKNRIDVNNYTSGLYQIEIKTDQYTSVKKWIKL